MPPFPAGFTNSDIAEFLDNVAAAYIIKNKSRFEIIAYENAAESVAAYPQPVYQIWKDDAQKLDDIPNIGSGIIKKLDYLFAKNQLHPALKKAFKNIHPAVFTFIKVNGIGPKTAFTITNHLDFPSDPSQALDKLIEYAQNRQLQDLPRLGEKSQNQILNNTLSFLGRKKRMTFAQANKIATRVIDYLKTEFPDTEFVPLGSLRRHSPTVGDIDIAARSTKQTEIIDSFVNFPQSLQTIAKGPKKASIRIKNDIHIDLMVEPPKYWGSLLVHFTGSKFHNILLRRYALNLGYSLSEYGIRDLKTKILHTFKTEKSFYHFLKLCYIEPQNRLGETEVEAAQKCYNKTVKN
jgi:DNA polymerase (family 10)